MNGYKTPSENEAWSGITTIAATLPLPELPNRPHMHSARKTLDYRPLQFGNSPLPN